MASVVEKVKKGDARWRIALEINFAAWLMIGCATMMAIHLVEYLN
jgi:hypothetical protein